MKLKRKDSEIEEDLKEDDLKDEDLKDDQMMQDDLMGDDLTDDYLGGDNYWGDDFYGAGGQTPMKKHQDLLKDLTNFNPYLKDSINNWLGLTWDEEKSEFVRNPALSPILTIQGASWCIGYLKTYTRGNNIITDIGSDEYKNLVADMIEAIWLNLGTREDLGIRSDGDLLRVANELQHASELALMGAGDGKYNKFLGTTYSSHTTMNPNMMMGRMNPMINPLANQQKKMGTMERLKRMILGQ